MGHDKLKHWTSLAGIFSLTVIGGVYVGTAPEPRADVLIALVAAIAGLGGYSLRKRKELAENQ